MLRHRTKCGARCSSKTLLSNARQCRNILSVFKSTRCWASWWWTFWTMLKSAKTTNSREKTNAAARVCLLCRVHRFSVFNRGPLSVLYTSLKKGNRLQLLILSVKNNLNWSFYYSRGKVMERYWKKWPLLFRLLLSVAFKTVLSHCWLLD